MKFGISLPNKGEYGHVHKLVELAQVAEGAGWDGFFIWDHYASGVGPHVDPWIAMAAIAANTNRMRLGILVTPLSRRRPWKVAREIVSRDHLSNGRMVMGVGLGDFQRKEFWNFGEVIEPKARGEILDESLEIINGLQSGKPFNFKGEHYKIADKTVFQPTPVQQPRVPVWVGGMWPNKPPFRRAARWDGVVPLAHGRSKRKYLTPDEISDILIYIGNYRTTETPLDVCMSGILLDESLADAKTIVSRYEEVGVTWWHEFVYSGTGSLKQNRERIRSGPPRKI